MTKDTGEQFYAVVCRDYTLSREEEPMGSKETPKLGQYWKLQPIICTVNMSGVNLAHTCVKPLARSYVCQRVGPFSGPFRVHFGPFSVHFRFFGNMLIVV